MGEQQKSLFAMASRLEHVKGKARRSGGDWHRDRMAPQFKTLVYLSDVSSQNGPFCLLPKSDTIWPYGQFCTETGFDYFAGRWRPEAFASFYERAKDYLKIFVASKGTVILFNSSNIHSGLPICEGCRYAITNYFYGRDMDIQKMRSKWVPCARPIGMPEFRQQDC